MWLQVQSPGKWGDMPAPHSHPEKGGGQDPKAKEELIPTAGQEKKGGDAGQEESKARTEAPCCAQKRGSPWGCRWPRRASRLGPRQSRRRSPAGGWTPRGSALRDLGSANNWHVGRRRERRLAPPVLDALSSLRLVAPPRLLPPLPTAREDLLAPARSRGAGRSVGWAGPEWCSRRPLRKSGLRPERVVL